MTNEPGMILTALDSRINVLLLACALVVLGVLAQVLRDTWKK